MNRYIIIFTIVSVFYLPLGFVTVCPTPTPFYYRTREADYLSHLQALFSMDLLHEKELAGIKSQYTVTMATVAIATYIAAIGLVVFVDRRKVTPYLMERLSTMSPTRLLQRRSNNHGPGDMPTEIGAEEREKSGQSGPFSEPLAASPTPIPPQKRKTKRKGKKAAGAETPEAELSV